MLLDSLSVVQNLAMPFSLDIEPPSDDLRAQAEALAQEVGLDRSTWDSRVSDLSRTARTRVRLGRALALDPQVLLLEHPTAAVPREDVAAFGLQIRRIVRRAAQPRLALTADRPLLSGMRSRLDARTRDRARLAERRSGWFSRLLRRQTPN